MSLLKDIELRLLGSSSPTEFTSDGYTLRYSNSEASNGCALSTWLSVSGVKMRTLEMRFKLFNQWLLGLNIPRPVKRNRATVKIIEKDVLLLIVERFNDGPIFPGPYIDYCDASLRRGMHLFRH